MGERKSDISENKPATAAKTDSKEDVGWDDVLRSLLMPAPKPDASDEGKPLAQDDSGDEKRGPLSLLQLTRESTEEAPNRSVQPDGSQRIEPRRSEGPTPEDEMMREAQQYIKDLTDLQTGFFRPKTTSWLEYLTGSAPVCDSDLQAPGLSGKLRNSCNVDLKSLSQRVDSSVVKITNTEAGATGTGFPVCRGNVCSIITNDHVTQGASSVVIQWDRSHGHIREFRSVPVLASKPKDDLAILTFDAGQMPGLKPLKINTAIPQKGDKFASIGHPLGIDQKAIGVGTFVETSRSIVTDRPMDKIDAYTTTGYKGNSGGPIVDLAGDVRGVTVLKFSQIENDKRRLGAIPAGTLENFIKEASADGKIRSDGVTSASTQYYDGIGFSEAAAIGEDAGRLLVAFEPMNGERARAALIDTNTGSTMAEYENIIVAKDKHNRVTGAETPDGKPLYSVIRDSDGGIVRLTHYGPDGKPARAFVREGSEQSLSREALISSMPAREVGNPPPGKARLTELPHSFNSFREIDPATGRSALFAESKNINITADGIIRIEEPVWNFAITGSTKVAYEAPGRNFSATENADERTIKHDVGVKEVLDKKTGKTSLVSLSGDRKVLMTDVTDVASLNQGELWALSGDRMVAFSADGDRRFEHDRKHGDFKVFDQKSDRLIATTDILGNPVWRFDQEFATAGNGMKFGARNWDLKRPTVDSDGHVVLKSLDGKSTAKLLPRGEASIENAGSSTRLFENGTRLKALGQMVVEMQTIGLDGNPSEIYRPVYENGKLSALETSGKQKIVLEPAGVDWRFDEKTGHLVSAPDPKFQINGEPGRFRWNPAQQNYVVEKTNNEAVATEFANPRNFDTSLLDQTAATQKDAQAAPAQKDADKAAAQKDAQAIALEKLDKRFLQLKQEDLKSFAENPNIPKDLARDAFVEILQREYLTLGDPDVALEASGLLLDALEKGKDLDRTAKTSRPNLTETDLSPAARREFHFAMFSDMSILANMVDTASGLNKLVQAPEFSLAEKADAGLRLQSLLEPTAQQSVRFTDLAKRYAAQLRKDIDVFVGPEKVAVLQMAERLEGYAPAQLAKKPITIKKP